MTSLSSAQSGHLMRAAFRSPHEPATDHEGEPAFRIAAVKILLDHLLDDRPEKAALIEALSTGSRTPARNDFHTPSGTCRNDGRAPGRGRFCRRKRNNTDETIAYPCCGSINTRLREGIIRARIVSSEPGDEPLERICAVYRCLDCGRPLTK